MNPTHPSKSDNPSELGILIILLLFIGLFAYVFIAAAFPSHEDEKAFARAKFVRVDIEAEYGIDLPARSEYSKTIQEPEQVQRLVSAAQRSGLGHWSRKYCRLSRDHVLLTFTSRAGNKYTAYAYRCVACSEGRPCGKDRSYKDDDIDDPLLKELSAQGFSLVQDDESRP